ncbi:MAG: hypothetical protein IKW49_00840 [Opitutales bacterium]|nr:hypothetical protein [Opitutales bacterium]
MTLKHEASFFQKINRSAIRALGCTGKALAYPFHWCFPQKRFTIPTQSGTRQQGELAIPKIIWQTNFSEKSTLPIYLNYRFNRLLASDFEHRYVSTEARLKFFRETPLPFMPDALEVYEKLADGAAQADFWRIAVLYLEGGIYMDIDATLVAPLSRLLEGEPVALYIGKKKDDVTNYFLATTPRNPVFKEALLQIRENILSYSGNESVFVTTGPAALKKVLLGKAFSFRQRNAVCIQGAFTNEYFQYMDKPRSKWIHKKSGEWIKKG